MTQVLPTQAEVIFAFWFIETRLLQEFAQEVVFNALMQGSMERFTKLSTNCSNFARVRLRTKCLGTPSTGMM